MVFFAYRLITMERLNHSIRAICNDMKHTLATAAKATGKGKTTIFRAIKSGKLSASFENGVYEIDPAELHRVFKPVPLERSENDDMEQSAMILEQKIEFLERELKLKDDFMREQSKRFDALERRLDNLMLLLTHQHENQKTKPIDANILWKRIFRR